jgi:lysophospholipase L1-like esterase
VYLGWPTNRYQHQGVRVRSDDRGWQLAPTLYASSDRIDDGVFGLGGVRFTALQTHASVELKLQPTAVQGTSVTWDLAYRFRSANDKLLLQVQGTETKELEIHAQEAVDFPGFPGPIQHTQMRSQGLGGTFRVESMVGNPELLGLVVEGEKPGVVVDTLALIGARAATMLAWDESSWVREVARRQPELVVLTYGTNESGGPVGAPQRFARHIQEIIQRVRQAAPASECLVVLPIDRSSLQGEKRLRVIREGFEMGAKSASCATWNALDAMGGEGSMNAWRAESPAKAGSDGLHLTANGYNFLGKALARDLIASASGE